jgi:hypothetical protein
LRRETEVSCVVKGEEDDDQNYHFHGKNEILASISEVRLELLPTTSIRAGLPLMRAGL